jgi:DNA-directed RNA polymerase subunit RPC12/RpoP
MSNLPTLDDAQEAVEKATGLIPWLEDPYECDNCGAYCEADTQYVGQVAEYTEVWDCPECSSRYFRERE